MDKELFIEKFTGKLPKDIKSASPQQLHDALGKTVMEMFACGYIVFYFSK